MVEAMLEAAFPNLRGRVWAVTSPSDMRYNCIAWAAGITHQWWWPDEEGERPWPTGVTRATTLEAFRDAFATLGYSVCDQEEQEDGYEKVALFTRFGIPTHAARQLPNGRWTSKLGIHQDIEHALPDLTGMIYGSVALVMKRPITEPAPPTRSEP